MSTMTLEQVRDELRHPTTSGSAYQLDRLASAIDDHIKARQVVDIDFVLSMVPDFTGTTFRSHGVDYVTVLQARTWAAMLAMNISGLTSKEEAHLRREVKVPDYWAAIGDRLPDGSGGEIVLAYQADDGNGGEAARSECNQYINDVLLNDRVKLHLVPLYLGAAPTSVATDGQGGEGKS